MPADDERPWMLRALELAARGEGWVEPNPMVGCVVVRDGQVVGEGWHARFGGPHAEVAALQAAGERARGATLYVTLEPCCHHGQTPPCTEAILRSGVARVVAAQQDPFPRVAGGGLRQLAAAGVEIDVGMCGAEAARLNAPYLKLLATVRPWTIAKWAMTLDGKLATRAGDSRWISNESSRAIVHKLRGRMDAIVVGSGTARADDPLLTARPPGARTALRVVVDSAASLDPKSQLVRTARETPVLVAVGTGAAEDSVRRLIDAGCETFVCRGSLHAERLAELWSELGRRRLTNVLVEGGGRSLGTLFDAGLIDEVHAFIAPKIAGGDGALSPVAGLGVERMSDALKLVEPMIEMIEGDVYLHGRVAPQ